MCYLDEIFTHNVQFPIDFDYYYLMWPRRWHCFEETIFVGEIRISVGNCCIQLYGETGICFRYWVFVVDAETRVIRRGTANAAENFLCPSSVHLEETMDWIKGSAAVHRG